MEATYDSPAHDPVFFFLAHGRHRKRNILFKYARWSIYLGDPAVLPSELVGATIVVQSRKGQSWTTTVTAVLDRGSRQVIVTDSGRLSEP